MLHLIETQEAPAKPPNIHHAFEVEDFEATKVVLRENGYEIDREGVRYDGQCFLFIFDPDGNSVEFCTSSGYCAGAAQANRLKDRALCRCARIGKSLDRLSLFERLRGRKA